MSQFPDNLIKIAGFTVILVMLSCVCGELPSYIEKCQTDDKECILRNINKIVQEKFGGDGNFGLKKFDPFPAYDILIQNEGKSVVGINLNFTNNILNNLSKLKAYKVKGFGKNPDGVHSVFLKGESLSLASNYAAKGKVLILPVYGTGTSNQTLMNPNVKVTIYGKSLERNGQLFMDVKKTELSVTYDRLYMYFDNLFNGDKALGDNFNEFLNQNWKEIASEMEAPLLNGINNGLFDLSKAVFDSTPYTDIFEVVSP